MRRFCLVAFVLLLLPVRAAEVVPVLPAHADPGEIQLPPSPYAVKVRPELLGRHPRIFFDADELEAIREKARDARVAPMVGWLLHDADLAIKWTPSPRTEVAAAHDQFRHTGLYLQQLAFAYVLTGDAKYLAAERRLMRTVMGWANWDDYDLGASHLCFALSLVYDWLYDQLTPGERRMIEAALLKHGRLLLATDPATGKPPWWTGAYFQNHGWIGHTAIAVTAMALYDLHPQEMQGWLDHARAFFQVPYQHLGLDGGNHEGAAYARYGTEWIVFYVNFLRHISGENLFDMPYLKQVGGYFCQTVMPNWVDVANFGDCPTTAWDVPISDDTLVSLAAEYHDGHLIWLRDHNYAFYAKDPGKYLSESPLALVWVDPSVEAQPLDDLPLVGLYPDLGLVIARTDWTDAAAVVALHCGAPGGQHLVEATPKIKGAVANNGHTHPDANSYLFWADHAWRIGLPGAYTYKKDTHNENTWLVGGVGQMGDGRTWFDQKDYMGKPSQAHLVRVATSPAADYLVGEAAPAYPPRLGLTQFRRHLLFVKAARPYVVVYDQLAAQAPRTWASYLHAYGELRTVDESGFEMGGAASAFGTLFGPVKLALAAGPLVVLREHTDKPAVHGSELKVAPAGASLSTWLVTVIGIDRQDVRLDPGVSPPKLTVGFDDIAWDAHDNVTLNGQWVSGDLLPAR